MNRPDIRAVAFDSGVSIKTVSRVVNDEVSVTEATRARVLASIERLGYIPNTAARSLKSGTGRIIGIVIDSLGDPFFAALASAVEDRAIAEGLSIVVASTGKNALREREQLLALISGHNAAGVIFAPLAINHSYLDAFRQSRPIVAIDRPHPDFDSVVVDDYHASFSAVRQLIEYGHRRIAFFYRELGYGTIVRRYQGYLDALSAAGITVDEVLVVTEPVNSVSDSEYQDELARLMSIDDRPTAFFAANTKASLIMVGTLGQQQREQVAMIAFGEIPLAEALTPAVTCINQDPYAIGNAAIDRLLALRRAPGSIPQEIILPALLLRRGSGEIVGPFLNEPALLKTNGLVFGSKSTPARTVSTVEEVTVKTKEVIR